MVAESTKPTLRTAGSVIARGARWLGIGAAEEARGSALKHLVEIAVGLGVLGFLRHWLVEQTRCLVALSCQITGPHATLLVLCLLSLVAVAAVLTWRLTRTQAALRETKEDLDSKSQLLDSIRSPPPRPAPFKPIPVEDRKLHLRWYIRHPPKEWLHWQSQIEVTPQLVKDVLDGPYHSSIDCGERLREDSIISEPHLSCECPGCGSRLWQTASANVDLMAQNTWDFRWQTVEELKRMHMNGNPLEGPTIYLERPKYWKGLLPLGS
jgi:hypothetical protein